MGKLLEENNINEGTEPTKRSENEDGKSTKERKTTGRGEAWTSRLCLSDHKLVQHSTSLTENTPAVTATQQVHTKREQPLLHVNRCYRHPKFANNSEQHADPIDQIKVNSQTLPDQSLLTSCEQWPHNGDRGEAGVSDWAIANSAEARGG